MVDRVVAIFLRAPALALLLALTVAAAGWAAFLRNPKDALPDIAENLTIVYSEWQGRSPKDVDEQVTYPLTVTLQGISGVREIRATSGFGWSIIYVVFNDSVDFYWARSRVIERLSEGGDTLPEGVRPSLGPDATPLGQVFWYTVENGWHSRARPGLRFSEDGVLTPDSRAGLLAADSTLQDRLDQAEAFTCPLTGEPLSRSQLPLDRLRSIQDFDVKLALESVEGVAEVASVGGYVREYQIDVDPQALAAFGVTLDEVAASVRASNLDIGAEVLERNGMEVLVRGVGFMGGADRSAAAREEREAAVLRDLEDVVVAAHEGVPIFVRQLGTVAVGPAFRRGALDKMGAEAVGASVVMRYGADPLAVIQAVKMRVRLIEDGLPPGVRVNAFYDRSRLIEETMGTLGKALTWELLVTIAAVLLFLAHVRASLVVAVTLPLAALFAFICMQALGIGSNIMSLAGIAIAIGTMVDMAIVMTENIYQHLARTLSDEGGEARASTPAGRQRRREIVASAAKEVSGAILTAIATTVISFLPVFFLQGEAARLFSPLAWTKTLCLVGSVLVAIVVVPPLAAWLLQDLRTDPRRGRVLAVGAGLATAAIWLVGPAVSAAWADFSRVVRSAIGLGWPIDSLLLGALVGLVVWLSTREKVRSPLDTGLARVIVRLYEPALRWLLAHQRLFAAVTASVVAAGLVAWLGLQTFVAPVFDLVGALGFDLASWSAAWWVHLVLGSFAGMIILPLLVDTVLSRGRHRRAPGQGLSAPIRWSAFALAALAAAGTLHGLDLAGRWNRPISTVLGAPETDPATGKAVDLHTWAPVAAWLSEPGGIGQEFMPPLDEGDFLYMPSLLPAASINTALEVMQKQDVQFARIPEVETVVGKLGRVDSALDPAPLGMLETVITLKPRDEWPLIEDPEHPGRQRRRTMSEIWASIQEAGQYPGVLPSVRLQPIRTRVEMLSTGLNAPVGLKVFGASVDAAEGLAVDIERLLGRELEGAESISALRTSRKPYLEIHVDRAAAARYGIALADVQSVIEIALGGRQLTWTYEGLDRYPVRVRYARELRDDPADLDRVYVHSPSGARVPLAQVATVTSVVGPMSLRREGPAFVSYVTMAAVDIDETTLVERADAILGQAVSEGRLAIPSGSYYRWTGTYERNLRTKGRLLLILPIVLLVNAVLIYLHFRRFDITAVVFLAIPVAFAGGFLLLRMWPDIHQLLYSLGILDRSFEGGAMYLTVAVWIGFIALFGIAVDDGIVMGTYLSQSFSSRRITHFEEIEERVLEAGLRRIRPCLMTTVTTLAALLPVMLSTGRGSELMVPMAIPVFGGMAISILSLFVVPVSYCALKQRRWRRGTPDPDFERTS